MLTWVTGELEEGPVILEGGNASGAVVRVWSTVRKPWLDTTDRVTAYMEAVRARGVDLPRTHGRDQHGRLILDYVPGVMAIDRAPLGLDLVRRLGGLVRAIHDASSGLPVSGDWEVLIPTEAPDLLCHNDLATWNLVIDGDRLVFIDWDGAGPSTRIWDLAYAALAFAHLFPGADAEQSAARLAAVADGYGADEELREALPGTMADRAQAMHDLLRRSNEAGREPWGSMYLEGHGERWAGTAVFIREHQRIWHAALSS